MGWTCDPVLALAQRFDHGEGYTLLLLVIVAQNHWFDYYGLVSKLASNFSVDCVVESSSIANIHQLGLL